MARNCRWLQTGLEPREWPDDGWGAYNEEMSAVADKAAWLTDLKQKRGIISCGFLKNKKIHSYVDRRCL
jgi:hypothetical protein